MKEAAFYTKCDNSSVQCNLCPHQCTIAPGLSGRCLTRTNVDGVLIAGNYLRPVAAAVDPIEKKPLYHFYPGSQIFSTGPNGCNFKCSFCQNAEISQTPVAARELSLDAMIDMATQSASLGIAYTYAEPCVWYETITDVAPRVRDRGLKNVMVTNGYIRPEPLKNLCSVIDAMNIDIKSMSPDFYATLCKATLEPVLRTCETVKKQCHLEITNLLIPDENDDNSQIDELAEYIKQNLGADTPLHLSRYFPHHKMRKSPTDTVRMHKAWQIARTHLKYVYLGNLGDAQTSTTICPGCGAHLIERSAQGVQKLPDLQKLPDGTVICKKCGAPVPIYL